MGPGGAGAGEKDAAWGWMPAVAVARGPAGWAPPPGMGPELEAYDAAWAAAEAALVRAASSGEVHAALWRRSEMLPNDVTPLEDDEKAARDGLRAAVDAHRGGGAGDGAGSAAQ